MDTCCICKEMEKLLNEQKLLEGFGKDCRYLQLSRKMDTIPFMLVNTYKFSHFQAMYNKGLTPFFRIESLIPSTCCAKLRLLKPSNLAGRYTNCVSDLYTLQKTDVCIHVNLCCFVAIESLAPQLVDRTPPFIEVKV
ncbi:CotY/CotZ family spore coat protein [Sporosarcina sp. OR05]|uniref:CotY/CotZ family spore coat protein n=1 Tax=Sporosarcina sp. OR05 TaxID=2969819 RepID=UPI00352ABF90